MVSHTRGRRRRGGVDLTPFLKTGRSHCLAICEAPARARVEGGKSLPRLSHSAPSRTWRAILLKTQLSLPTAHAPKSMCQEGRGDYRDGGRLQRWMDRVFHGANTRSAFVDTIALLSEFEADKSLRGVLRVCCLLRSVASYFTDIFAI